MRRTRLVVGVTMLLVAVSVGAAALLLNGTDDSAQISAAQACDLMDTPYDALATASVPGREWRWRITLFGTGQTRGDYHNWIRRYTHWQG